ncbi:hypothetical protein [Nocardia cyriacigeorgica]|uniref:hypothetical protein n=1 Tax=Nocardia cyriacigeorgica TaxID=135487 RepID=UPI002455B848|nr:hypothetical protein [Nocardia cyriacigeorgica]
MCDLSRFCTELDQNPCQQWELGNVPARVIAWKRAERIAVNAPLSLIGSKRIVEETSDWTTADAFDRQYEIAATALFSDDATEGVRAFTEKRDPIWQGR